MSCGLADMSEEVFRGHSPFLADPFRDLCSAYEDGGSDWFIVSNSFGCLAWRRQKRGRTESVIIRG
jgi:hypothetical protein